MDAKEIIVHFTINYKQKATRDHEWLEKFVHLIIR